eukprot:CAMPEP_0202901788 /NCGR_PEP_ID=MMETSP1392-20130828/14680_1 /ASSEMBLY_ACC=CAM_ASM_000868 /TAXON_ID=225041 /ORGANISM="Chlamydomonas chlamydogama, Strain SAG 11-48b" /LENGTH=479 /DNA_ID=CAMNT_0049588403 /DNA_START=184 /DNA_END=1623 /DNA_ORIENTATION=+
MRASLLLALGLCALVLPFASAQLERREHMKLLAAAKDNPTDHFKSWVVRHSKAYVRDAVEYAKRLAIWIENLEYVLEYNAKHTSHWLGMNAMADLTHEEYSQHYLGFKHDKSKRLRSSSSPFKYADVPDGALPASIDWRAKGAVSEVKNQMQCGSCWAFSTTGSVEGINAIVTGKLVSLSEQELVDCDTEQDHGCQGGLMDYAFEFIKANGGLDTEEDYPYTGVQGKCITSKLNRRVVSIDGYEDVPENDEAALKKAVAHQPVSVAIEADQKAFQLYMGGVFADESCGTDLDHGVLVVGYGKDPVGGNYWIVKNSWGPEWGDKGYIRMKAGVKAKEGLCGIAMAASYATKTGPNPDPGPAPGPDPGPAPGPKPGPVKCDDSSQCPQGNTCCCVTSLFSLCLQWGCCPIPKATCCEDNEHCCPSDLPVCDTAAGRCLPKKYSIEGSIPWYTKTPAIRKPSVFDRVFKRQDNKNTPRTAQV